jgi:hypothetical protein
MGYQQQRHIKKSQGFESWFFVIVVILAFALFFLILNKVWGEISTPLENGLTGAVNGDENTINTIEETFGRVSNTSNVFDSLIPLLVIGLFAFVLISAGAIIRHPIMIIVGVILLGVVITIAVVFSNMYNQISSSPQFASSKAVLPIQDKFMQFLPTIVVLMAIGIVIAIIWSRSKGGGGL